MSRFTYRIAKTELMAKGWSSLSRLQVEATDLAGKTTRLLREVADHGHGAAVLPIDRARGMCLLVRQWRAGAAFTGHDGWLIEVCAGLLDADDPEGCMRREALEELGTRVGNVKQVSTVFSSPGAVSEKTSLFMAEYSAADRISAGGGLASEHEDIEVIEMPLAEAYGMIAKGEICDGKTIILLQHAMIQAK
jgi:nudix-type nucleoside diphosphatase (YffH/AdpP family)